MYKEKAIEKIQKELKAFTGGNKEKAVSKPVAETLEMFCTTGVARAGCMFCMFGVQCEKTPNRFQQMKVTHPKQYAYCMKPTADGGLGIAEVLDYIGVEH